MRRKYLKLKVSWMAIVGTEQYFTGKQDNHKIFRRLIYETTKINKDNLLPFFRWS